MPSILIALTLFFPLTVEHLNVYNLEQNFGKFAICPTLLNDKSTLLQQFQGNLSSYSRSIYKILSNSSHWIWSILFYIILN